MEHCGRLKRKRLCRGNTDSTDFPTLNAYDSTYNGSTDAFITKLNASGNALVYSTYLGGTNNEYLYPSLMAVDSSGNAYVTGSTRSADFPTLNAYDSTYNGSNDVFITKLNASGNALVYSTYLGGSSHEFGTGIAVDPSGNAYVTGYTASEDFPTLNGYQSSWIGSNDAFVVKLGNDSDLDGIPDIY